MSRHQADNREPSEKVWIVDDDESIRWVLNKAFQKTSIATVCFSNADDAMISLNVEKNLPNVIISDIRMPGSSGLELLNLINQQHPDIPIIIMTAHSDLDSAVNAFEGGAFEYIAKPFDVNEVLQITKRACTTNPTKALPTNQYRAKPTQELIGTAPAMQSVFKAIGRLSRSTVAVLISGESGSGKELIAHALHKHSPRANKTFIALNMAAIPHELMESELFGHEKGAFTGAQSTRMGRFEQADGGTLFLGEIGDMPATLQTRLLRVLSDGQFYRVGGHTPITVNVRIIAATHQNLEQQVNEKNFREDLYHRLNVIRIHAPALRERREDIPVLMKHFLKSAADELEIEYKTTSRELERYLSMLKWPGNVRQLQNTARWLTVMASGQRLKITDLPKELLDNAKLENETWELELKQWATSKLLNGDNQLLKSATPAFERIMIVCAMNATGNRRQDAAKALGWGRNTLSRKIKELGLDNKF